MLRSLAHPAGLATFHDPAIGAAVARSGDGACAIPCRNLHSRLAGCLLLGGVLVAALYIPVAQAQGLLPAIGPNVELGDLRRTFERAFDGPRGAAQRSWTVTPSIDVEQTVTDNARGLGTGTQRGAEYLTTISPGLLVQGESARLRGTFSYTPQFRAYARSPRQNGVGQNLNASGRLTIFEDLLFINASAFAAEQSLQGGRGTTSNNSFGALDRVQTTSLSGGPLLQHRFGDFGQVELGYTYSYLSQKGRGATQNTPFSPALSNRPTTTNAANASFKSGEYFGRVKFGLAVQQAHYNGTGVMRNARRGSEILDVGYAVSRQFLLLGEIGHQDIRYGGVTPLRINGVLWSAGIRWSPAPDTSISVRYGRRDGGNSVSVDASTAPSARTRVTARYGEGVTTGQEDLQNAIRGADLDAFGAPVDRLTGTPLALTDNFAGSQGGVSRTRRASVSATLLGDVDTFSLSVNREERRTLTANTPGAVPGTTNLSASLGWQRELSPGLRGNASVSYGTRSASGGLSLRQSTSTLSTGLNYSFSETLSGRANYSFTKAESNRRDFSYSSNLVTVGLRKTF